MQKKSHKAITEALNKYMPADQQFPKYKPIRKKRISKKKYVEEDVPTFGNIIKSMAGYGFVYKLTISTALGTRYYVGSRHFDATGEWKNYCTSSDIAQKLIDASRRHPELISIVWEVLEQAPTSAMLKSRENIRMRGCYNLYGKDSIINVADPYGISLRTGKSLRKCKK